MKRLLLWLARTTGWFLLWVLCAGATFLAYHQTILERVRARTSRAAAELEQAQRQHRELQVAIAQHQALREELDRIGRRLAQVEGMLPPATDVAGVEDVLRRELEDNGLRLVRFGAGAPETKQYYRRTTLTIEVAGPLSALLPWPGLLVARVSPTVRVMDGYRFRPETTPLMDVRGVQVEPDPDRKAHRMRVVAWTFSQSP